MSRTPLLSRLMTLPVLCALVPVVWLLSYGLGAQSAGTAVGRQSSTSGLVVGFAFMLAPVAGAAGFGIGLATRWLLRRVKLKPSRRVVTWLGVVACMGLAVIAVTSWRQAGEGIYAADRAATPRILQNAAHLQKVTLRSALGDKVRARRVFDELGNVNHAIAWDDRWVSFTPVSNGLKVALGSSERSVLIPIVGIDYVIFVDAIPVSLSAGTDPALAVLITGRATGQRDLLAVISDAEHLVYLELLDRKWSYLSPPLAILPTEAGDVILVGSEQSDTYALASRDAVLQIAGVRP